MVAPSIPLPGKILGIVKGETLEKVAFISVEEHVSNCAAFFEFVVSERKGVLRDALLFHDLGKKLFRVADIYRDTSLKRWAFDTSFGDGEDRLDLLKRDYAATMCPGLLGPVDDSASYQEVAAAYLDYAGLGEGRGRRAASRVTVYPVRKDPAEPKSEVVAANYRLPRPFGNHAAPIQEHHLPEALEERSLLAALIRRHHSFQVSNIIPEVEKEEKFDLLLYDLMTMDHLGSSWAERLILSEEGGFERDFPPGVDFGEVGSGLKEEPTVSNNPDGTKTALAELRLGAYGREEANLSFSVTYFVEEVGYVDPSLQ